MHNSHLPPFYRLPVQLRQQIYSYLLPQPSTEATTINYKLEWPNLENASDTTFTPHQLDRCRCPQDAKEDLEGETWHIYTRYVCESPEVHISARNEPLWMLQETWGVFNILRPASKRERREQPRASFLRVSKMVYEEATPLLYRSRNFILLSGPCPRGRYQGYATETWLSRLSPLAQTQITDLTLICQPFEEDYRDDDVHGAYESLACFVLDKLPGFRTLHIIDCGSDLSLRAFAVLFDRNGLSISVKRSMSGKEERYDEAQTYLQYCETLADKTAR